MWEKIGEETYFMGTFLPCTHLAMEHRSVSNNQVEVMIVSPKSDNVDYLCVPEIKRNTLNKHLSAPRAPIYHK